MFAAFSRKRRLRAQAAALYAALVHQTRQPDFYRALGVPDSFDGRFDLLVLHSFLLFRRLRGGDDESRDLAQAVFDTLFADMDDVLRESGVGDLSIGRKIRGMSEAFYGRVKAYDDAWAGSSEALAAALTRNVFAGGGTETAAEQLAHYARAADRRLQATGMERLAAGEISFPALAPALADEPQEACS